MPVLLHYKLGAHVPLVKLDELKQEVHRDGWFSAQVAQGYLQFRIQVPLALGLYPAMQVVQILLLDSRQF